VLGGIAQTILNLTVLWYVTDRVDILLYGEQHVLFNKALVDAGGHFEQQAAHARM
jgi:hypothetical protein